MSVLEAFFFTFSSDAGKLKQSVDDATKSSDELEKKLNDVDASAGKTTSTFESLAINIGKAAAAYFSFQAIKKVTQDSTDLTSSIRQQAQVLDMSVEKLSKFQQAVKLSGGTSQGAVASLTSLRDKFVEFSRFGGTWGEDAIALQKLGVSAETMKDGIKDPLKGMESLAGTFEKLDHTQQLFLGKKLGFDIGTIAVLSQGEKGLREMMDRQKELGYVTEASAEQAFKFKMKEEELNISFETGARTLVGHLYPALTWIFDKVEKVVNFLNQHTVFATAFFSAIVAGATYAAVAVGILDVATLTAILPFIAIAAVVALVGVAIAAVVDDIATFIEGGDSLVGRAVQKWPELGRAFTAIKEIIVMAFEAMKMAWHSFMDSKFGGALMDGLEKLKHMLEYILGKLEDLWKFEFKLAGEGIDKVGGWLSKVTGGHFDKVMEKPKENVEKSMAATEAAKSPEGQSITKKLSSMGWTAPQAEGIAGSMVQNGSGTDIAKKLMVMGWSKEQAAGIAGSFMQESGGKAGAVNSSSGATGVGQWLGSRKKDFEQFSGKPLQGSSLDEQLKFFNYEVTEGKEKRAGDKLRSAQTAEQAALFHSVYYERPGAAEANNAKRQAYAGDIQKGLGEDIPPALMSSHNVGGSTKSTKVEIGAINVSTQATDAEGTAKAIQTTLNDHMKNAFDEADDGILA